MSESEPTPNTADQTIEQGDEVPKKQETQEASPGPDQGTETAQGDKVPEKQETQQASPGPDQRTEDAQGDKVPEKQETQQASPGPDQGTEVAQKADEPSNVGESQEGGTKGRLKNLFLCL